MCRLAAVSVFAIVRCGQRIQDKLGHVFEVILLQGTIYTYFVIDSAANAYASMLLYLFICWP